jgi:hypothetical protein
MSNKNTEDIKPIVQPTTPAPIPEVIKTPPNLSDKSFSHDDVSAYQNRLNVVDTVGGSTISKGVEGNAISAIPNSGE